MHLPLGTATWNHLQDATLSLYSAMDDASSSLVATVAQVMKASAFYHDRLVEYNDKASDTRELGPSLLAMKRAIDDVVRKPNTGLRSDQVRQVLMNCLREIGTLRSRLRAGATDSLEKTTLSLLPSLWSAFAEVGVTDASQKELDMLLNIQRVFAEASIAFPFEPSIAQILDDIGQMQSDFGSRVQTGDLQDSAKRVVDEPAPLGPALAMQLDNLEAASIAASGMDVKSLANIASDLASAVEALCGKALADPRHELVKRCVDFCEAAASRMPHDACPRLHAMAKLFSAWHLGIAASAGDASSATGSADPPADLATIERASTMMSAAIKLHKDMSLTGVHKNLLDAAKELRDACDQKCRADRKQLSDAAKQTLSLTVATIQSMITARGCDDLISKMPGATWPDFYNFCDKNILNMDAKEFVDQIERLKQDRHVAIFAGRCRRWRPYG